ncbi:hypothetical protein AB0A76_29475 [Streptomyces exfoliatus]|uniref:Uncharacterized protein n=1 Tax=Streptomyces exfoliatus TaxID=1905 RepID=A0ABV3D477_STREX
MSEERVGREGTLVLSAPNTPPATTRLHLTRGAEHEPEYTAAPLAAAALALIVCLLMTVPADFFGKPRESGDDSPCSIARHRAIGAGRSRRTRRGDVFRRFKPLARGWGLVVAAYAALFGVFGQLATIVMMTVSAAADQVPRCSDLPGPCAPGRLRMRRLCPRHAQL